MLPTSNPWQDLEYKKLFAFRIPNYYHVSEPPKAVLASNPTVEISADIIAPETLNPKHILLAEVFDLTQFEFQVAWGTKQVTICPGCKFVQKVYLKNLCYRCYFLGESQKTGLSLK